MSETTPIPDPSPSPFHHQHEILHDAFNVLNLGHHSNQATINSCELPPHENENTTYFTLKKIEVEPNIQENTNFTGNILYDKTNVLFHEENLTYTSNAIVANTNDSTDKRSSYVYQILNSCYEGNFLLAAYNFESNEENKRILLDSKKTTYFSKNKLAKIIINHEIYRTNDYHISSERLLKLAELTVELFPEYLQESFYTQRTSNKSSGGAFQVYYSKLREKEIAIGRLKPLKRRKTLDEDAIDILENLKPLQQEISVIDNTYIQLWSVTAVDERTFIYKKKNVKEILENIPSLKHPDAYVLVKIDFEKIFNKSNGIFNENWTKIARKIITLAKTKKTDADIKQMLKENQTIKGEEHEKTLALMLLPLLFKRTTKVTAKSKNNSSWIPEKKETLKSFIVYLQITDKLQSALTEAHADLLSLYNDHKLIIRPYVVICGQSLSDIKASFVIADTLKYQLSSPSEAVDICFQLMKLFNLPYSSICNHVWQFCEKNIYKFEVKNLYAGVAALTEKLS